MSQLSLFSADLTPPRVEDLGGLLAAHAQLSGNAKGTRLSILLAEEWRARALVREFRVRDVAAEVIGIDEAIAGGLLTGERSGRGRDAARDPDSDPERERDRDDRLGAVLLRTARTTELDPLARDWTRGAVKSVPAKIEMGAGVLRCWTIAAGWSSENGFMLGLDRHAPDTWDPLASGCARAGFAAAVIGVRGGGPGLRIVGHRRYTRLVELLGTPPPEAPPGSFPLPER